MTTSADELVVREELLSTAKGSVSHCVWRILKTLKMVRGGEIAHWLRAPVAFAEDPGSVPGPHRVMYTHSQLQFQESNVLF